MGSMAPLPPPDEGAARCCFCWIDGISTAPIRGWDGIPMCRAHLAKTLEKNLPLATTRTDIAAASALLLH
ncbi:hypothetical protein XI09_26335 [Bradyrhizobium sp. CCBAU 11386]|uniref:hypothetical protein n=1 Tax=Bradyrhizobium sp. CCBAU 11386 TaxID=1630837 RepID=UPI0023038A45|nr:hypothetical protein [Bradyrhizobium sp. CCBAU 11386]MDA9508092.1 hypothetical protein [Bradyrhizobium sp. CCBAU 11386]